ncbi:purine-nucleoside phosphorylase [Sharpea azabuensis]|uniref:purine-nucleoside phosphorylase n=1 Tax=Sharpea azabuensis TaxID=322505 RepID=UPI00240A0370|nr:purine-nucleoside phosphorylase [Sharpea azabuensis]MDD6512089.1 purine-nucleoside phosphorylase [Sharpea azabuensis]
MYIDEIKEAASYIQSRYHEPLDLAIVLGSGLGPLADQIKNPVVIDYKDIPHFPQSTIKGHEGKLYLGELNGKHIAVMKGRVHYYEGHSSKSITLCIRVFRALNIRKLILTNACGGIREDLMPGQITLISDHISFLCPSPLIGPNLDEFGPRFKDMTDVYTKTLREKALQVAKDVHVDVKEGIYAYFTGPQFETPAEIRALKVMGADMVGMSTVPEAIVARHSGMEVLGISLITNRAAGLSSNTLSHQEVEEEATKAQDRLVLFVNHVIASI